MWTDVLTGAEKLQLAVIRWRLLVDLQDDIFDTRALNRLAFVRWLMCRRGTFSEEFGLGHRTSVRSFTQNLSEPSGPMASVGDSTPARWPLNGCRVVPGNRATAPL